MSEKGKKNRKKTGLGLAIWILLFLIILIVFLVKQEEIKENFDKSGATALIEKKIGKEIFDDKKQSPKAEESGEIVIDLTKNIRKPEPVTKTETITKSKKSEQVATKKSAETEQKPIVHPKKTEEKKTELAVKTAEKKETTEKKNQETSQKAPPAENKTSNTTPQITKTETKPTPAPVANTIPVKICFVAIDSEGPVVRKQVTRNVHKDSPMGEALGMLLSGPSSTEAKTGCRSLIPAGTRLLSASVKNGVAILNFSEEFQFNQFGAEGSLSQLMQVVYTATEFGTVKSVQILIEGQKRDYLTEGVWIGSPLNRSSF